MFVHPCRDDIFEIMDQLWEWDAKEPAKIQAIIKSANEFAATFLTHVSVSCGWASGGWASYVWATCHAAALAAASSGLA